MEFFSKNTKKLPISVEPLDKKAIINRDTNLIEQTIKGSSTAFAQLLNLYQRKVMTLGLSFFKNKTDADDFVQDVFIKVYTNLSTFRGESLFSTWLMRLAYNTAVNSVNRRKEYLSLSDEIEIFDNDFTPEENQMRKLTANAISETIKKLPKIYATCLDMYFFYDIKQTDISEILDIPLNTVKSYIFRAKKLLKEKLEESGVIGEEYE